MSVFLDICRDTCNVGSNLHINRNISHTIVSYKPCIDRDSLTSDNRVVVKKGSTLTMVLIWSLFIYHSCYLYLRHLTVKTINTNVTIFHSINSFSNKVALSGERWLFAGRKYTLYPHDMLNDLFRHLLSNMLTLIVYLPCMHIQRTAIHRHHG